MATFAQQVCEITDAIRARLDQIALSPRARDDIDSLTDSLETLARVHSFGAEGFDWSAYGLTRLESRMCEYLRVAKRVISRGELHEAMYYDRAAGEEPLPKIIDVHISHIRPKLARFGSPHNIETVRGSGYKLVRREDYTPPPKGGAGNEQRVAALRALQSLRA